MSSLKTIVHASQMLTGRGIRRKEGRHPKEQDLDTIIDGAIVADAERIHWVGKTSDLPKKYLKTKRTNLNQRQLVTPGLVDCHTHLVFAGDRSEDFALRCAGLSYEEVAQRGGGIARTVAETRRASAAELFRLAQPRIEAAAAYGTRTIEIKSGYGLSLESEIKILKVIQMLKRKYRHLTIRSTFLGAHDFPKEKSREKYLDELIKKMLPKVAREKLADACDIFIDEGYYSLDEGRRILEKAQSLKFPIKLHADELANTESAKLACELGALSADHLLQVSDDGILALAQSKTVAVLLPGTAFYLKKPHAPARRLIDAGARVAISTDFNPGTCVCLSLPTIMTIAALYLGLSKAEIFAAVTYNAAAALGLEDRKGALETGFDADFVVHPFARFEELYYQFGWAPPLMGKPFTGR